VINNVTVYEVDVVPNFVPSYFRSGMSTSVNFYQQEKRGILLIPSRAVKKVGSQAYAFVSRKGKIVAIPIKIGLENSSTEVISGLSPEAEVIIPTTKIISDTLNTDRGPRFNLFGGQRR
jgi:macrolide-specific efflux system membrane fusion protein